MTDIHWSLDHLVLNDNALFSFGWLFHGTQDVVDVQFCLAPSSGRALEYIPAEFGKFRNDVGQTFSQCANAMNSGYLALGAFSRRPTIEDALTLECTLRSGAVVTLPITPNLERQARQNTKFLLRRGFSLLRDGKFRTLLRKIRHVLIGRTADQALGPLNLSSILSIEEQRDVCIIVDHDLGGGANRYREKLIDELNTTSRTAVILSFEVHSLSHLILIKNRRVDCRTKIANEAAFVDLIKHLSISDIVYNTCVSFIRPEAIPVILTDLKRRTGARLRVMVHDYFLVCPSQFLLNVNGAFCNVPDLETCGRCLANNRNGFTSLFPERSISKWRDVWGSMLKEADEIRTFSNSSAEIIRKAYPASDSARMTVVPHATLGTSRKTIHVRDATKLRIGVVGHIGFHKGAKVVQQLADRIKDLGRDVTITVIGSIEASCDSDIVTVTGRYGQDELPDVIARSGVNIMLFPSICPETFSYVVQEVMEFDLPVACFDIGAPPERLRAYSKGLVLKGTDPDSVLSELISFHQRSYLRAS